MGQSEGNKKHKKEKRACSSLSFRIQLPCGVSHPLCAAPSAPSIIGEGKGNPLQYSCLGNPMDKRILAGYSPWGHKESDMNEHAHLHTHTHTHITILYCSVTSPSLELFTMNTFPHLSCTLFSPLTRQYISREWRGVFLAPRIILGIWEARSNTVERRNSISKKRERKRTEAGRKWGPQK